MEACLREHSPDASLYAASTSSSLPTASSTSGMRRLRAFSIRCSVRPRFSSCSSAVWYSNSGVGQRQRSAVQQQWGLTAENRSLAAMQSSSSRYSDSPAAAQPPAPPFCCPALCPRPLKPQLMRPAGRGRLDLTVQLPRSGQRPRESKSIACASRLRACRRVTRGQ